MTEIVQDVGDSTKVIKYEALFSIKDTGEFKRLVDFDSVQQAYDAVLSLQGVTKGGFDSLQIVEMNKPVKKDKYKYPHDKIKDIFSRATDDLDSLIDTEVSVAGWIRTVRSQSKDAFSFFALTDGTCHECLQVIVNKEHEKIEGGFDEFYDKASTGTSIRVTGQIVRSPAKGQTIELMAKKVFVEGVVHELETYPISKKKTNLDTLRGVCHLRSRTAGFASIFRIRNALSFATHKFYQERDFLHLDPNIISVNECEGGAGVFTVTELDMEGKADFKKDHFGKRAFLTVSSQLQLEALACSMGNVYTTNKSFRSEHSLTSKHVSEFTHLEIEQCFTDFNDLMNVGEDYVKYVINYVLEHCYTDLESLNRYMSKGLLDRLESIKSCDFHRMTYKEAIEMIQQDLKDKKVKMKIRPKIGDDLGTEHENYITEKFGKPVFVTHWPLEIKSFYMKQCDDGTCESFDLLMPYGVGELIGASQREESYDKLVEIMEKKGIDRAPLEFYLDLRKYGTCQHGGFGLGMDRFLMLLTGMSSIKDVIPFPVYYTTCNY